MFNILLVLFLICLIVVLFIVTKSSYKEKENEQDISPVMSAPTPKRPTNPQNKGAQKKEDSNSFKTYNTVVRTGDRSNNMNCDLFMVSGKNVATNRKKSRRIYVFPNQNVMDVIAESGFVDPIEYHKEEWAKPSEAQVAYLRDVHMYVQPTELSMEDASALLTRHEQRDYTANPQLFEFATEMRIPVSYYSGKKLLYGRIFHDLQGVDKIAFFAFCVYRYLSKDSQANMNQSRYKNAMYEFAELKAVDQRFLKSMDNYEGSDLRFFGTSQFGGLGGSKNTIAYKEVVRFLQERGIL